MTKQPSLQEQKVKKLPLLEMLLLLFFLWYYLLPSASNSFPFVLALGMGFLYIAYVILMCAPSPKALTTILKFLVVVFLIAIFYYFFTVTHTVSNKVDNYDLKRFASKFQQMFFTALPILLTYRVFFKGTRRQRWLLLFAAIAIILYVIAQSVEELAANETASRVWGEFADMSEKNVGTYNFVYAVSISLPAIFALANHAKIWPIKVLLYAFFAYGIVFLVMAQYTISLIIAVSLCFFGLLLSAKRLVTKVIALVSCPVLFLLLPTILEFIANNISGAAMSERLFEIADYFSGETIGYNLSGRFTLYRSTVEAFLSSPFFGNSQLTFDGHATFLTVLADIGLVGGIPFYWLYFSMRKHVGLLLNQNRVMTRCFLLSFLAVILTGFLNPIHAALPLPMVAWFVVPLAISMLLSEKENDNGTVEK